MPQNLERVQRLRQIIKANEASQQGMPVELEELPLIAREIVDLHDLVYGQGKDIPITAVGGLSEDEAPSSQFIRLVAVIPSLDKRQIVGARQVAPEVVNLLIGNPTLVHPSNYRGVYRHLLAFQFEAGQNSFQVVGETALPILTGEEIGFNGEVHFISGFNAQHFSLKWGIKQDITVRLDQYTAQYLAMYMYDAFVDKDPVLEAIKIHGRGMDKEYVLGAELLNDIFTASRVEAEVVERVHRRSDLRGFINMLNDSRAGLGKSIVLACTKPTPDKSLEELTKVRERYG